MYQIVFNTLTCVENVYRNLQKDNFSITERYLTAEQDSVYILKGCLAVTIVKQFKRRKYCKTNDCNDGNIVKLAYRNIYKRLIFIFIKYYLIFNIQYVNNYLNSNSVSINSILLKVLCSNFSRQKYLFSILKRKIFKHKYHDNNVKMDLGKQQNQY